MFFLCVSKLFNTKYWISFRDYFTYYNEHLLFSYSSSFILQFCNLQSICQEFETNSSSLLVQSFFASQQQQFDLVEYEHVVYMNMTELHLARQVITLHPSYCCLCCQLNQDYALMVNPTSFPQLIRQPKFSSLQFGNELLEQLISNHIWFRRIKIRN